MTRAERFWRLQRLSGLVVMVCLTLALATLFDGLRTGIFGSSDVRLVAGEEYAVSGPMPPKTEHVRDFVIEGMPADGSVSLLPENVFTGYWFGGGMWRGRIIAAAHPQPGVYALKVRDKFGEKQNPALVFTVRVFADAQDRRMHSPSVVMRWTGQDAYLFTAVFFVFGVFGAVGNYVLGRKWSLVLAEHGCGEIFRVRRVDGRVDVGVELPEALRVPVGAMYRFTHPSRGDLGRGRVIARVEHEITLRLDMDAPVRPGDVACPVRE